MDPADIAQALRSAMRGEVDESSRRRAEYSSDASNYRVVPQVVAFPEDTGDILAAAEVSRRTGTPLTTRGAWHVHRGERGRAGDRPGHLAAPGPDPRSRPGGAYRPGRARGDPGQPPGGRGPARAAVRPRPVHPVPGHARRDDRQQRVRRPRPGLRPDRRQRARTRRHRRHRPALHGLPRRWTRYPAWSQLVSADLALLRTEFGRLRRQVSGYSLEHLLPENGASLARALAGTEGTVVTMLGATVRLVPVAQAHALVVLGYPDVADAADAVPAILAHAPLAIEGLDARMVDVVRRRKGSSRVPGLPPGDAWLMVEMGAASAAEAVSLAQAMVADAGAMAAAVIPAGPQASAVWRIREDGAGLGGRTPANRQAWPGWEDAAVPPDRLGAYLREFRDAARLLPAGRAALRALRRRLHPCPDRLPAGPAGRRPGHAPVPHRRGAPGHRARRVAVRRARRRPGPQRAAAASCTHPMRWPRSARSRTCWIRPTCSTPVCWSGPGRSTPTCAARPPPRCPARAASRSPRTTAT